MPSGSGSVSGVEVAAVELVTCDGMCSALREAYGICAVVLDFCVGHEAMTVLELA